MPLFTTLLFAVSFQFGVVMAKWYIISKIRERRAQEQDNLDPAEEADPDEYIQLPEHLSKYEEIELVEKTQT